MEENQIVLHSSATQPETSTALVPSGSNRDVGRPQSQVLDGLRQDREEHRHKQVWIKDAHGGPYRKVRLYMQRKIIVKGS